MTSAAGRTGGELGEFQGKKEGTELGGIGGEGRKGKEGRIGREGKGREDGERRGNKVGEDKELARGAGSRVTRKLISSQSERWAASKGKKGPTSSCRSLRSFCLLSPLLLLLAAAYT